MAVKISFFCVSCRLTKEGFSDASGLSPTECGACQESEYQRAKSGHLAKVSEKPNKDRLRAIESFIYDFEHRPDPPPLSEMTF